MSTFLLMFSDGSLPRHAEGTRRLAIKPGYGLTIRAIESVHQFVAVEHGPKALQAL
jgi:hypothetical protein